MLIAVYIFGAEGETLLSAIEQSTGLFSQSVCLMAAFLEFVSRLSYI